MKNIHIKNTLNYFSCFIKIILFLSITSITFANENKIGSVTELNGTIVAINDKLEERDLLIHDPIFLNEEIFVTQGSSATIQFNDSTAIIMKELTSINVSEFENSKNNPKLKAELLKGKIVIESGSIAKKDDGEMIVSVTTSSLGLRGTRIDVDLKPDGKSNISLAADSFGNVGSIDVTSGGQTSSITSTEQVLEISENSEATSRDKSEDEKEIEKSVSETLIQSSKIDENEITQQLQKKLEDGKLQDANNDGIVDESDVELAKEQITDEKKLKINFIVENSKDENTEFLSNLINQSDEKNTGEVIEKIIDTSDNLVEGVVENLSDKDNKFLTTTTSEGAGLIKEKIFETIVAKETDKSAAILSKVMAKSDDATVFSVINNITEKNTNQNSKLSLKVMADFSEKNSEKLESLAQNSADQIQKLTVSAVEEAASSQEDADLIGKIVSGASEEVINKVITEVTKNSTEEKQALSAKVMKTIVETNPDKMETLSDENKENIITQTIQAAKNQSEGTSTDDLDLTNTIAKIISNSDSGTTSKILEELRNASQGAESKLSLEVVNNLTKQENYEEKMEILEVTNPSIGNSISNLIEDAVKNATSEEDLELITSITEKSKGTIGDKIINSANQNEASKEKITKIIVKIVEKNPEKALEIINKNKSTNTVTETIKNKIENGEAVSTDDFDDVFENNVSPN
ncbi:FecR domain-containing protein [Candidatus Pelagibacter ubique]|nr:FecR domain-containing protein [Candidatus Pelagibacter ubique]